MGIEGCTTPVVVLMVCAGACFVLGQVYFAVQRPFVDVYEGRVVYERQKAQVCGAAGDAPIEGGLGMELTGFLFALRHCGRYTVDDALCGFQ